MLSTNSDVKVIGGMLQDGEFVPVYASPDGDVLYDFPMYDGIGVISAIKADGYAEIKDTSRLEKALRNGDYGKIQGLLFPGKKAVAILSDDVAEWRSLGTFETPSGATFEIDLREELSEDDAAEYLS